MDEDESDDTDGESASGSGSESDGEAAEEDSKDANGAEDKEKSEDESEEELVHESLKTPAERRRRENQGAAKYVPADETRADRDRRTVFVGNVPVACVKEKVGLSSFHLPVSTAG